MGRPSTRERTEFGQRLFEQREAAGLTQSEVAEQLGLSQRAYAAWERDPVALLPERFASVAEILGTTSGELLGETSPRRTANGSSDRVGRPKPKRAPVAPGKLGQVFEAASRLPRRQQQKIIDFVEPFIADYERKRDKREEKAAAAKTASS